MIVTRISIAQPVFTTMVMVAIMVLGLAAWRVLPVDRFPPLDFPVIIVSTTWSGATPEAVETSISRPVEDALSTLSGIETLTSTSSQGHSSVEITFTLETDSRQAVQDVRDRLSVVLPDLPEAAEAPRVARLNPLAGPVLSLALSNPAMDPGALTRQARDVILPALTAVEGVGSANLIGATDRQVLLSPDPDRMRAHGLSVTALTGGILDGNLLAPAGTIDTGLTSLPLQLNAEAGSLDGLGALIVARSPETIRLQDVASVTRGLADAESLAFRNGKAALTVDVIRVDGANVVALAQDVLHAIDRLGARDVLGGTRIDILLNDADEIAAIYRTLRATLIEGMALAVLIVFLFLNSWRSTVITAVTLPVSFLGTLAVIRYLGFSLNMLSMLALTLSVGILIDDAIVVRENITRHLQMGKSHARAALEGTQEIGLAVLATTLALCAVFLPLAFMDGIIGRMFLQFGVTVAVAVLISMFVSFTLDPMLSCVWHDPDAAADARRGATGRLIARFNQGFGRMAAGYRHALILALRWRKTTFGLASASLLGGAALLPLIGTEMIPKTDESRISIAMRTPVGSSQNYTALKAGQLSAALEALPAVRSIYTTVAAGSGAALNEAQIEVMLTRPAERDLSASAMLPGVRSLLARVPGVELTIATPGGLGDDEAPIALVVSGPDPAALRLAADRVAAAVAAVPGTADVRLSLGDPWPVLDFQVLPEVASDLGVAPQELGTALHALIEGAEVARMKWRDGSIDPVWLRLPEALRQDPAALADLPLATGAGGQMVTLGEVTRHSQSPGATRIERRDRSRVITVKAVPEGRLLGEIMADVAVALRSIDLPEGIAVRIGGDAELMDDTITDMAVALGLAVVFIYLVLASQFASFLQPLAIMASLPLAFSGVMLGLLAAGSSLNLYSMIGIVMLMGLVVKNAILLVDNANQHRRAGMPLQNALAEAGVTRFRPVMMTTLAMIFGMLPLALALHPGSEQSASMAQAVIGGLISSTLLTLVVVPVVLVWLDRLPGWLGQRFSARPPRQQPHSHSQS